MKTSPVLTSLFLGIQIASAFSAGQNNYSTNFPLPENPISENGNWINGGAVGRNWTNVRTMPGLAFGTESGTGTGAARYDDSIAVLGGTWAPNQSASAVIQIGNGVGGNGVFEEVELHLRTTISPGSITGYEINASVVASNPYVQVVRWNGPLGNFTVINARPIAVHNGDTLGASIAGNMITVFLNGVVQYTVTDSTFNSGSPGIGFFLQGTTGVNSNYGFSSFSASDSGQGNPPPNPSPASPKPGSAVTKDFNNDGVADLIWENSTSGQRLIWFMSNGTPTTSLELPTVGTNWHIAGVGDFLGNGQSDLLWESTDGDHEIWVMKGALPQNVITLGNLAGGWHVVGTGVFNNDGQADLVWENSNTGERKIWLMNSGVPTTSLQLPTVDPSWHIAAVADFLGNGQSDLVWENTVTGQRLIWLMNGGQPTTAIRLGTVDPSWHIAGAGDFLGTGQASLVWENLSTGKRLIWAFSNGQPTFSMPLPTVPTAWHIVDH
jgi:FG-GAP-like repeat